MVGKRVGAPNITDIAEYYRKHKADSYEGIEKHFITQGDTLKKERHLNADQ